MFNFANDGFRPLQGMDQNMGYPLPNTPRHYLNSRNNEFVNAALGHFHSKRSDIMGFSSSRDVSKATTIAMALYVVECWYADQTSLYSARRWYKPSMVDDFFLLIGNETTIDPTQDVIHEISNLKSVLSTNPTIESAQFIKVLDFIIYGERPQTEKGDWIEGTVVEAVLAKERSSLDETTTSQLTQLLGVAKHLELSLAVKEIEKLLK